MARYQRLDAKPIDEPWDYIGRPSISPALAGIVAAGAMEKRHRILDLGCGRGMDLLSLADLGFRKLEGLDRNRASLRVARAAERKRFGKPIVSWHWGNLGRLNELPKARFDWVYDTFLTNNLRAEEEPEYLRRVARVLKPGGRLLVQCKVSATRWTKDDIPRSPLFRNGPSVLTHFPEGIRRGARSHESVLVTVLTRRKATGERR